MRHYVKQHITLWLTTASAILCTALMTSYWLRPDTCAAITFFPAWFWTPLGIALILPSLRARRRTAFIAALALWIGYTLTFSEEPRSLLTRPAISASDFQSARKSGKGLRVITMNCAGGSAAAAAEVRAYNPDIVLLQESPGESDVAQLARELFGKNGGYACGVESSIIANGKVRVHKQSKQISIFCTSARITLDSGAQVETISLRLAPPVFRLDLWSPSCWREQTANRRTHRKQLHLIAQEFKHIPNDVPVIAGGDFNAPAGDAACHVLHPRLRDAFTQHGVGWGNTVLNDAPVQRIDQIWASRHWQVVEVRAHKTQNSDHRLVVCDMVLQ